MPMYMIVHEKDKEFVSYHINSFCKVCAKEKNMNWIRANYNLKEGKIYCLWEAQDRETLLKKMERCSIPCEEIIEVQELTPEECGWDIHGELEE